MAGQTLHDRFVAAKHTIYGQNVEKAVCKATTEEIIGPKKKHLDCKCLLLVFKALIILYLSFEALYQLS